MATVREVMDTEEKSAQSEAYERTHTAYRTMGFVPLEVFPRLGMWPIRAC